jgi:dTMP kinase
VIAPRFYGVTPPGVGAEPLPGQLIAIEGADGVGGSTQIALLKEWLEDEGFAVVDVELTRSQLAGRAIERARRGRALDPISLNLLYATDLWDQQERQVLPALRAGMVVLADRYMFSVVASAVVHGLPRTWIEDVCGFALVPDRVFYLDIETPQLLRRVLSSGGLGNWEAGPNYAGDGGAYANFERYQTQLSDEFRRLAKRNAFTTVDAGGSVLEVFQHLRDEIAEVVRGMEREPAAVVNGPPSTLGI